MHTANGASRRYPQRELPLGKPRPSGRQVPEAFRTAASLVVTRKCCSYARAWADADGARWTGRSGFLKRTRERKPGCRENFLHVVRATHSVCRRAAPARCARRAASPGRPAAPTGTAQETTCTATKRKYLAARRSFSLPVMVPTTTKTPLTGDRTYLLRGRDVTL
jgi:hypothetical protein